MPLTCPLLPTADLTDLPPAVRAAVADLPAAARAAMADLPAAYAELETLIDQAGGKLAPALDPSRVADARTALAAARALLIRDRYRIGFLGPSQYGKSSTLNNVVGKELAKGGDGGPATSTVSRFLPCPPDKTPQLALEYMTATQFQQRRGALARCIGGPLLECPPFDPKEPAKGYDALAAENAKLIPLLETDIARATAEATRDETGKTDARGSDRTTLLLLLKAYQQYGRQYVLAGTEPHRELLTLNDSGNYSKQLKKYTNHRPIDGTASASELVWQLKVEFPTADASATIELIDLPGIGTMRQGDDLTTLAFMDQLDGALVFLNARQAQDGVVGKILTALQGERDERWPFARERESLRGRIWLVAAYTDGLNRNHYGLEGDDETFLDHMSRTLKQFGIKDEHLRMVGNLYHEELGAAKSPAEVAALHRIRLKLAVGADGKPEVPPKFAKHPVLRGAFEEVIADGGIARLRRVIATELAAEVLRLVCRHVARTLRDAAADLSRHIDAVRRAGTFGEREKLAAREWATEAKYLSGERAEGDPPDPRYRALQREVEGAFRGLKRRARDKFAKFSPVSLPCGLRIQHEEDAETLSGELRGAGADAVVTLFKWAQDAMAAFGANQPPIPVDGYDKPSDLLAARLGEDLKDLDGWCFGPIVSLADPVFFPSTRPGADSRPMDFPGYQTVVRLKTDALVHELAHRAGRRLCARLKDVCSRLTFLRKVQGGGKSAIAAEDLEAASKELDTVAARCAAALAALDVSTA